MTNQNRSRVLLVDDDPDILGMYKLALEKTGEFEVTTEPSAVGALELLEGGAEFELVITDVMMARMDGWEFLDTIRKELGLSGTQLPVIIVSAFESDVLVAKALGRGANGCLTKPIRPLAKLAKLARIHTGRQRSKFDADT